ncbi:MAG: hypothetical protein ABI867_25315 [Kofleriaceae bacterium]
MPRALTIAVLALAACDAKREMPATRPPVAVVPAPAAPKLPGTLWFVDDSTRTLARIANATRTDLAGDGAQLFPSRWSMPDGRLVAIASRGDGGAEPEQLALVGGDGTITRLARTAAMVRDPVVGPRGEWIAFTATADGTSELHRLEVATGTITRLAPNPQGNFTPTALTGDWVAFASSRDGDSEIYRTNTRGVALQRLTAFHRDDFAPAASPDGATIAFASDREGAVRIFLIAADGTQLRRLTTRASSDPDELDHVWSRDGKHLAYVSGDHVYVRDVAAATERDLTPRDARDAEPTFSPDGAWIAVARADAIVAIELATGTAVRVTTGGAPRLPRWHP